MNGTPDRAVLPKLATPPASLMLPALDHEQYEESAAQAAAVAAWPEIERYLASGAIGLAVRELESLAVRMRELTVHDPAPWLAVLTECRAIVYDDIAYVATLLDGQRGAEEALLRCRAWDAELAGHIDALLRVMA